MVSTTERPKVSVIINTDGRAPSLRHTLDSLHYLRYPRFEVVVVPGPTADGTHEVLAEWKGQIKIGACLRRNLSESRNIGIEMSSGEILAFLDDDAIPEPEWLDDLVPAFADLAVGVAGGFVHDHTGRSYQWRFGTVNRFGNADESWRRAASEFNFPLSFHFPHVLGTNCLFRRSAIIDVHGFDEEFEYYLDESDVICRLVDQGWHVAQLDRGFVHHKFLSNQVRKDRGVTTGWYSIIKNKLYFSLVNGRSHATTERIIAEANNHVGLIRQQVRRAIENGVLAHQDEQRFEQEADKALRDGLTRGLEGNRSLGSPTLLTGDCHGFLPFFTRLSAVKRRCVVFVSRTYPPGSVLHNEVLCSFKQLVQQIAHLGHHVHVLTEGHDNDHVYFEEGVWVHRCKEIKRDEFDSRSGTATHLPLQMSGYALAIRTEVNKIAARRPIDCVHATARDVETSILLRDGAWPLVIGLYPWSHVDLNGGGAKSNAVRELDSSLQALERELLIASDGVVTTSAKLINDAEHVYGLRLDRGRVCIISVDDSEVGGGLGAFPMQNESSVRTAAVAEPLPASVGVQFAQAVLDFLVKTAGSTRN